MDIFTRSTLNPIMRPDAEHSWESKKVYNCAAVYEAGQHHIFYRAVGQGTAYHSSLGHAVSHDGEHVQRFDEPLLIPELALEKLGIEDPRITKINNTYHMTYTGYDGQSARLFIATSDDLKKWKRHGEAVPNWDLEKAKGFQIPWDEARYTPTALKKWHKAGGIFSEKIQGSYWMLFGDSNLWLARSEDGIEWEPLWEPFIAPRAGMFDSAHVEMGPPPIKTEAGWLVLYHGIDEQIIYRMGYLLLSLDDPSKILARSDTPIFQPHESYELSGVVDILPGGLPALQAMSGQELETFLKNTQAIGRMPQVIFCCGATVSNDILRIYYGASDSVICTASANFKDVVHLVSRS